MDIQVGTREDYGGYTLINKVPFRFSFTFLIHHGDEIKVLKNGFPSNVAPASSEVRTLRRTQNRQATSVPTAPPHSLLEQMHHSLVNLIAELGGFAILPLLGIFSKTFPQKMSRRRCSEERDCGRDGRWGSCDRVRDDRFPSLENHFSMGQMSRRRCREERDCGVEAKLGEVGEG
ncbi:hypothetical protein L484_019744 [Morus notabilis]|uniref:Uncharacterized protein n=1 Tax=Morus notabilis TaxID=981085 RepID=W9QRU4_9ROSA|nr:hypothetical protein L484_019744 [Morus notabilis]